MKKMLMIAAVAMSLFAASGCEKDWSCSCYNSYTNSSTSTPINNETLLNARSKCKDMQSSTSAGTVSCSLQ